MTKNEALKMALEALESALRYHGIMLMSDPPQDAWKYHGVENKADKAITAIKEALAQPEQKYRRGNRLICLETEEYCVIHISGTDRQWVKFPDSHVGVYTNEQVAELFELLPKEPEQEPVGEIVDAIEGAFKCSFTKMLPVGAKLYTTPPQRTWVGLTDEEREEIALEVPIDAVLITEAKLKHKNTRSQE